MKRILILGLICIPNFIFAQVITDSLVSYWPFNGDATDASGNGYNGIIVGNPGLVQDRFGNENSAYIFDGIDDYIKIENPFYNYSNNTFSASYWLNISSFSGVRISGIVVQSGDGINDGSQNVFGTLLFGPEYTSDPYKHYFWLDKASLSVVYNVTVGFPADSLNLDQWNHYVITCDGSEMRFYQNGILKVSHSFEDSLTINSNSIIEIGKDSRVSSGRNFKGIIDDIAIYDKSLSIEEIQAIYNSEDTSVTYQNSLTDNIFCDGDNVGIGTAETYGYKLAVSGEVLAEGVKVALQSSWADYVFENDYNTMNIEELDNYIRNNKHLPGIPNEQSVGEEGYNLGDMDAKLLAKIEELTLYIIQLNERIKKLEEENKCLKQNENTHIKSIEKKKESPLKPN